MRLFLLLLYALSFGPVQAQDVRRLGVFGMVESIDPLVVTGREINVPLDLRVISPLGPGHVITLGDTLALVVSHENDRLFATRMLAIFPIVGPVTAVKEGKARVMGTDVHLPPDVGVKAGQWVVFSGLWSGTHLVGVFEDDAPSDLIGGSVVIAAPQFEDGFGDEIWTFSGQPEKSGLRVRLTAKGVFGGKVDLVLWQGYASAPIASQTYLIHGSGIIGTATDALMPVVGELVTRCAVQGRVVYAAPDELEAAFKALDCAKYILAD
jgi:hypothetical protein